MFEREEAGVRVYRTGNGVPVLIRRKVGSPLLHLGVYALGGARDERAELAGLTMLMGRTSVKGTERRSAEAIADDAEMLGGSVSPSVGSDNFGWSFSVPTRHTPAAIELLSDVVQHATFPDAAVDTERVILLADLAAMRDDMYRYPMRLATEAAYAGHPYGMNALGTEDSVARITADDIRAWHHAHVRSAPSVIAAVSDLDSDDLAAALATTFADLEPGAPAVIPTPQWPMAPMVRAEVRNKAQTALALAFPAPARSDPDRVAARLIAGVSSGLGGRLFEELRGRRSLAYTVHAFASARALGGMFMTYMATSPTAEHEARAGLLTELARLGDGLVGDDELARAQASAIGTHAIGLQSGATVLADVIDAWLFGEGLHELEEHDARVRAVTQADLQRVARQSFGADGVVEGIVRGRVGD